MGVESGFSDQVGTKPSVSEPQAEHKPLSAFDQVTENLLGIGALPLHLFADNLPEEPVDNTSIVPPDPTEAIPPSTSSKHNFQAATLLYHACRTAFGNSDCLKWDFIEEKDTKKKSCILTITRPNGLSRSFRTKTEFPRKTEAKAAAAALAMEMNVMDFIQFGDRDHKASSKNRNGSGGGGGALVLAPLDAPVTRKADDPIEPQGTADPLTPEDLTPEVLEIQKCCEDWRAGKIKPQYFQTIELKAGSSPLHGCALKIQLTIHVMSAFSVHTIFPSQGEAKTAVAKLALKQGVIEFIKHGNGQKEPAPFAEEIESPNANILANESVMASTTSAIMSLQAYCKSLPKPFPETPGLKPIGETNPIAWINYAIQTAKGSRLTPTYTFITDPKTALHGCLLRLDWNDDSRTYIVDTLFGKRVDSKSAVCFLAVSQGLGAYIRSIVEAIDMKLTPDMKKLAMDNTILITRELGRVSNGGMPEYKFDSDKGAFGCTMSIEVSPELNRKYMVPMGYRSKIDARCGAVLLALKHSVLEFIRFRGEPPPLDYEPSTYTTSMNATKKGKNKAGSTEDHQLVDVKESGKKEKSEPVGKSLKPESPPMFETKEEALAHRQATKGNNTKPKTSSKKSGSHKGPFQHHHTSHSSQSNATVGTVHGLPPRPPDTMNSPPLPHSVVQQPSSSRQYRRPTPPPPPPPPGYYQHYPVQSRPPSAEYCSSPYHVPPRGFYPHLSSYDPDPYPSYRPPPKYPLHPDNHPVYTPHDVPPSRGEYYSRGRYSPELGEYAPEYDTRRPSPDSEIYRRPSYPPPISRPHFRDYSPPPLPPSIPRSHASWDRDEYGRDYIPQPPRHWDHPASATAVRPSYDEERLRRDPGFYRSYHETPRGQKRSRSSSPHSSHEIPRSLKRSRSRSPVLFHQRNVQRSSSQGEQLRNLEESSLDDITPIEGRTRTMHSPTPSVPDPSSSRKRPRTPTPPPTTTQSYITALIDYCQKTDKPKPEFGSEVVETSKGVEYKVWVIMGKERMELPTTFTSLTNGMERVSKQVLGRFKGTTKKRKESEG